MTTSIPIMSRTKNSSSSSAGRSSSRKYTCWWVLWIFMDFLGGSWTRQLLLRLLCVWWQIGWRYFGVLVFGLVGVDGADINRVRCGHGPCTSTHPHTCLGT